MKPPPGDHPGPDSSTVWDPAITNLNKYTLDPDGKPVLEPDLLKWGKWFETADR